LDWHRSIALRRVIATICVGLSVMLSGQGYISLKDRAEHEHHHAHFANPLAGTVRYCVEEQCGQHDGGNSSHHDDLGQHVEHDDGDHDAHDVGPDVARHHAGDGARDATHHQRSDGSGHQHGDATIVFIETQSFFLVPRSISSERSMSVRSKFVSITLRGPDHPPKQYLELTV
jgi:hypothetical protein